MNTVTNVRTNATGVATPTDLEIEITRTFDAPRRLVFEAWTTPEHLQRWMLGPEGWSMPVCELDLRAGGLWRFVWRKDDGQEMAMTGEYHVVEPPERLVSTESWGEGWPETLNTIVITEEAGQSKLTCTVLYPTREARDAALQSGMTEGVDMSYNRLAELLSTLG
jgi:uncharacterized protein YndB with AHSA1/START domain